MIFNFNINEPIKKIDYYTCYVLIMFVLDYLLKLYNLDYQHVRPDMDDMQDAISMNENEDYKILWIKTIAVLHMDIELYKFMINNFPEDGEHMWLYFKNFALYDIYNIEELYDFVYEYTNRHIDNELFNLIMECRNYNMIHRLSQRLTVYVFQENYIDDIYENHSAYVAFRIIIGRVGDQVLYELATKSWHTLQLLSYGADIHEYMDFHPCICLMCTIRRMRGRHTIDEIKQVYNDIKYHPDNNFIQVLINNADKIYEDEYYQLYEKKSNWFS